MVASWRRPLALPVPPLTHVRDDEQVPQAPEGRISPGLAPGCHDDAREARHAGPVTGPEPVDALGPARGEVDAEQLLPDPTRIASANAEPDPPPGVPGH